MRLYGVQPTFVNGYKLFTIYNARLALKKLEIVFQYRVASIRAHSSQWRLRIVYTALLTFLKQTEIRQWFVCFFMPTAGRFQQNIPAKNFEQILRSRSVDLNL